MILGNCVSGRDNNLNLIRMLAASAVIVSHAFPLTMGEGSLAPQYEQIRHGLGTYAVATFFCISGFLIARSYETGRSLWHWLAARALRLLPGLAVMLLLTVLVLGPLVTTDPGYWKQMATWTYLPRNLTLAFLQYPLPGVFEANPYGPPINGSLWTLFYEVACWAGVLIVGLMGLLRRPQAFAVLVAIFVIAYLALEVFPMTGRIDRLAQLGWPFLLGMMGWVYRDKILVDWRIGAALWLLALVAQVTFVGEAAFVLALSYSVMWLAFVPGGAIRRYNNVGDYSYGTYIYAFPIQQLMVHLVPGQTPLMNMALAFPATLVLAYLSWNVVEERSMRLAKPLAAALDARLPGLNRSRISSST